jgi:hypothetical protein
VGEGLTQDAMSDPAEPLSARSLLLDPSLFGVIFSNVLSIVLATVFKWDLGEILWVYWAQNVIIGISNFIRIMSLKEFTTRGLSSNGRPVPETQKAKRDTAFFFLIHYGFFHFVYAMFLLDRSPLDFTDSENVAFLLVAVGGFALTHGYSFLHNKGADFRQKRPNLGAFLFYPYMRVVPMQLIILGASAVGPAATPIFMAMKTVADAGMHVAEHALFRRA